jgi:dihydrolipoamide dehydrogenase
MAREVRVPDLGDFKGVEVIEVLVKPGDAVEKEQPLLTLESEKATMEVPAPEAGVVEALQVKPGDKVSAGDLILTFTAGSAQIEAKSQELPAKDPEKAQFDEPAQTNVDTTPTSAIPAPSADITAEVVVLGAGPGGYSAAFRAADLGKQVVLVERYPSLGGVCLNVGCIPSKALLHAAKVIDDASDMAKHGIHFGKPEINLGELRSFKEGVVGKLTGGLVALARKRKVTVLRGEGRFTGPRTLEVATAEGTRTLGFEHCIIAAGSQSIKLPDLPGDSRVWDSTAALALQKIPPRLLVIGGGIIGLEMASVFAALGSAVDIVEMTTGLLPGTDPDLARPLAKRMKQRCGNIWLGTRVASVHSQTDAVYVNLEGPGVPAMQRYDAVLQAIGRRPNGKRINAEAAGIHVDEKGFIPTDAQLRTNVPHIFAIGDITRQPMLAHKAVHEGKTAAEVIAGHKAAFDARCIPSVVYTDPEVAWTGLTEVEAKQKGLDVKVGRFPWAANGRALGIDFADGFTKLLFDKDSGRILGGAAVGPNAGELMAEISLAIEMGADAQDIGLTVHAHPTLSETVAMAAEQIAGTLTDL